MSPTSEAVKEFFPEFLTLTEGYAGKPFVLLPWMQEFIDILFSEDENGEFIYSSAILEIPRKNAKTQSAAGLALAALVGLTKSDQPQIVCAAYDKDQARILYQKCVDMIEQNADMKADFRVLRSGEIEFRQNKGKLKVISSDSSGAHGMNPSMVICDELHTWKNSKLWDALTTGSGTRQNFLVLGITTAGYDKKSLLGELREAGLKVRHRYNGEWRGEKHSSSLYVAYGPEDNEIYDPTDWEAFKRHNPSWSIISRKSFEAQCDLNKNNEAAIRQLFHNEWVAHDLGWMPLGAWERCLDEDFSIREKEKVVIGVDASMSGDGTAVVVAGVDRPFIHPLAVYEKPDDTEEWLVPLNEVSEVIKQAGEKYDVLEVTFDPYWCLGTMQQLEAEGFNTVKFNTNSPNQMAPAVAEFYHAAMNQEIIHKGSEDLTRHVYNCAAKQTTKGTTITKMRYLDKIDAAVAAVIAYSRAKYYKNKPPARPSSGEIFFLEF